MEQEQARLTFQWPVAQAPVAFCKPHERVLHGDRVIDNYYWMIDYFKEGPHSAEAIDYLKAENAYVDTMMEGTVDFQQRLFHEMKARIKEQDESAPVFKNGYYYYTRTEAGEQYFKYCRKKGSLTATEELLLDVDAMAQGHAYFSVTGFSVSPNNRFLAFGVDSVSRREYVIYIKDLQTGLLVEETIKGTTGHVAWANDNRTFFYTLKNPETLLTEKIMKHLLGQAAVHDTLVYEETDKSNYIGVVRAKSGQYIYIHSESTTSSEVRFIDANQPNDAFRIFQPRIKEVLYEVTALADRFLILTNHQAQNFKLMECSLDQTDIDHWKEVIPHRKDVLLEEIDEFKDFVVISERTRGLVHLKIRDLDSGEIHDIDFGEAVYTVSTHANLEYNTSILRYHYTSLTTPISIFDYDMVQHKKVLVKQQEVLGGYLPSAYTSERLYATAADGAQIPISLVYKNGFKRDGQSPLLLYGYGSYGASIDPTFNSTRLSLLDRGFVFAIAHIRGGQEMGRQWYEDGKLMKKKNTFTDFITCGKCLIERGYTTKAHLYARGRSAGGLLMGAVMNMAPDLWHGVIAQVPFVDVVNTMLDETIPLTTNEFDEWGNPKEKEAYIYMKSYSPYENVEKKAYPHLLVTTGLHDSQVQYFEPAKWVAQLRAHKIDNHVLLFKTEMEYGHGGASGRFDYLKEIALEYAFLFALEGIEIANQS